ncbi:cob(I)yrinic acid a,c-diamide adenosyltransferase [Vulgatibacter sp.]|uniref:cob(I)yrinic acid a,c-diamide adenosyltransferase n=1 Tax=Vulgatibacter sp. TaxID=1971226 RepID=UPI003564B491
MTFRIYTKTGDKGETGLFGGGRVRKDDLRVEAYGEVDELNACLGAAESAITDAQVKAWIRRIQDELFVLGAELATPDAEAMRKMFVPVDQGEIAAMETIIDEIDAEVEPLKNFILPGGHPGAAHLHLARTVCRRAERRLVTFAGHTQVREQVIVYLNRLSDLLFMLARLVNHRAGIEEPKWSAPRRQETR